MAETGGRRGLGRGLSALLGEAALSDEAGSGPGSSTASPAREAPVELLRRNPDQPRRYFPDAELEDLARSVREKGVLQPILVRPAPGVAGEYQIVAGERRWRAAQRAGLRQVPIVVREDLDDLDVLEIGVIENVQRADLNPLEEALAYLTLMDKFGRTQEQVAETVGKSRSHVANAVRLLSLPESVHALMVEGKLSAGHARAIAASPEAAKLAERIVAGGLSVRQAEALARSAPTSPKIVRPPQETRKDSDTHALEQDLSLALGLAVEIAHRGGSGSVTIRYATLEQLDDLCRRLSR
jgi:ParB family chromosome partitioning protein